MREVYGFDLSVFESVSSRKNISVPIHDMGNENRFLGTFRSHSKRHNGIHGETQLYMHALKSYTYIRGLSLSYERLHNGKSRAFAKITKTRLDGRVQFSKCRMQNATSVLSLRGDT